MFLYSKLLFSFYKNPYYIFFLILGYIYLFAANNINNEMSLLATKMAGSSAGDVFFTYFPVPVYTPLHGLFLYLGLMFKIIPLFVPQYALFTLFSLSTLILTRAFFVNLTHLGVPEGSIPIVAHNTFGGDLLFSGHVATPVLIACIFWEYRWVRYMCIFAACLLGVNSLLGRYHYSIDVFVAPFIAYGVYVLSLRIFTWCGLSKNNSENV